ncbi:cob(I)alamin adenosyltransferase [Lampropedia hyalina DSM 16112]|jgi:cob(I)alamin adenosyltransferase|uniref:Cobalamin adenosyltransferase n=1 Tax=Lampropedia hyalina DSM 16112 TaxID=1122156 RepID=A0A1M5CTJ5_9BURK|nr:cob(I)yrinic acid a,c-diamide adenosyltransferase [Lampropedia hyalina]SHF58006.1 cob(I)alamin adenosyltransferase [Lampropedia hyalina DSM 16112]
MGNRLSKITTRTGDDGTTGLGNNTRVAKNSLRIQAIGDVDELNSHIGLLLTEPLPENTQLLLQQIQHQLFNLGGELSMPGYQLIQEEALLDLETAVQALNADLPSLREFILPAGTRAASQAHVCRTVARRAERSVVAVEQLESMHGVPRKYLNRLSDLLFVLARYLNLHHGAGEVYWKSKRLENEENS